MSKGFAGTTLRVAVLSAVGAVLLASCSEGTSSARSHESSPAGQAVRQLVGSRWVLTKVSTGTRALPIPESLHATWQFTADHHFLASDTVNTISGSYRASAAGFATVDAATTLVGYAGSDPVRLAIIAAFQAMTSAPVEVAPTTSPTNVTVRVPRYTMNFRRSGPAQTFPSASPTSTKP